MPWALCRVSADEADELRAYLEQERIRFTMDSAAAGHLTEPEKRVFVFGDQHPRGIQDMLENFGITAKIDSSVHFAENAYRPPLDQLVRLGEPGQKGKGEKYAKHGIRREHVPELIRMATDAALHSGPAGNKIYWAPVHAWWALAELRAEEAIGPLLGLLRRIDEDDDDWVNEDIPKVLAEIGPAALDPATVYLADPRLPFPARIAEPTATSPLPATAVSPA